MRGEKLQQYRHNNMKRIFNKTSERQKRKALRKAMPEAEIILWSKIQKKQIAGYKFRCQYGVGPFVVDFYCAERKLAIEIDGDSHYQIGAEERDRKRQNWIEQYGIRFLRFTNDDVRKNLYGVLEAIEEAVKGDGSPPAKQMAGKPFRRINNRRDAEGLSASLWKFRYTKLLFYAP
jgi:very-short-patch-repair endonuclease